MNDYERIARIIRYLDERHTEQPDLAALAEEAGLSPSRFHRLFSDWAAITPKDFLQCLTLSHARALLRNGESVLDAALGSGLSGPGRLHDLCVNLEAATPGEVKSGGRGWTITAGFAPSPFGNCLIAESLRGICHLSFVDREEENLATLGKEWPEARIERNDEAASKWAAAIFDRRVRSDSRTTLRAFVRGTPFQVKVWRALLRIPSGALVSYGRLAAAVGHPKASRAVGTAMGRNPLAYLVPCHRVIRETGAFGNYGWDPVRKRAILAYESGPGLNEAPIARRAPARVPAAIR
jgi:AraC family transcriptional regulator of adaptative response/methylated-DNA-[protein]-cysteine methyltransferase